MPIIETVAGAGLSVFLSELKKHLDRSLLTRKSYNAFYQAFTNAPVELHALVHESNDFRNNLFSLAKGVFADVKNMLETAEECAVTFEREEYRARRIISCLQKFSRLLLSEFQGNKPQRSGDVPIHILSFNDETTLLSYITEPLGPIPPLTSWDMKFSDRDEYGRMLLKTERVGRDSELEKLHAFLTEPAPIFIISGPGGQGKTKLALEFCRIITEEQNWLAYFLETGEYNQWNHFKLKERCLIVIDYAYSHSNRKGLVDHVRQNVKDIKLLLLERDGPVDLLEREIRSSNLDSDKKAILSELCPLRLGPLSEKEELRIFSASMQGADPPKGLYKATGGNPLISLLAIDLYRESPDSFDPGTLSKNTILRRRLDYVDKQLGSLGDEKIRQIWCFLAVCALVRGISTHDLKWMPKTAPDFEMSVNKVGLKALMDEAKVVLFTSIRPKEGSLVEEFRIEPDLIAAAILSRTFFEEDGALFGLLQDFVEALLPYRSIGIALTLRLVFQDLPEKEALAVKATMAKAIEWLLNQDPAQGKFDYVTAILILLSMGVPSELKREKIADNLLKWSENESLTGEQLANLCMVIQILTPKVETSKALLRIADHKSFVGNPIARFLYFISRTSENIVLASALVKKARVKDPANLFIAAIAIELNVDHDDAKKILLGSSDMKQGLYLLAVVLFNAFNTISATDLVKAEVYLGELRQLYADYDEPVVRGSLARALNNAISRSRKGRFIEPYLDELRNLHAVHDEPTLRELLATALYNAFHNVSKADPVRADVYLGELRQLCADHDEPVVREWLAKALYNVIYHTSKTNLVGAEVYLGELRELYADHDESPVREQLAKALTNAVVRSRDQKAIDSYLDELRKLYADCDEPAVRDLLATALNNAVARSQNQKAIDRYLDELRQLHADHYELVVRECLAKALTNAVFQSREQHAIEVYLSELRQLHADHDELVVRECLAKALNNAVMRSREQKPMDRYLGELRVLHADRSESGLRESLAKALFNAFTITSESDPALADVYLGELHQLHDDHDESSVREWLAKALFNAFFSASEANQVKAEVYLDELRVLHSTYNESVLIELFGKAVLLGLTKGIKEDTISLKYICEVFPGVPIKTKDGTMPFWMAAKDALAQQKNLPESSPLLQMLQKIEKDLNDAIEEHKRARENYKKKNFVESHQRAFKAVRLGIGMMPQQRAMAVNLLLEATSELEGPEAAEILRAQLLEKHPDIKMIMAKK